MAGIYIHIPFCRQACHYCNFHFSTTRHQENEIREALLKELVLQQSFLSGATIETIYFGGGTPSLMPPAFIARAIKTIRELFPVAENPEITLESNPDDFSEEICAAWRNAGINRLSIGIQSFFEEDLRWMNRAHNAEMARNSISLARNAGITNISIDLIYGGPTLSDAHWLENMETAHRAGVQHLSCYALTVEPHTALENMIGKGKKAPVDPDKQARHFETLQQKAIELNYDHYEISNLAQPGFRSRHNSAYWKGVPYLGIGPSAHSFNGHSRRWNMANNALYLQAIGKEMIPYEEEILTHANRINEYIMTSLRTSEGMEIQCFREISVRPELFERLLEEAAQHIGKGYLELTDTHIRITASGRFLSDGIAADLFVEEEYLH